MNSPEKGKAFRCKTFSLQPLHFYMASRYGAWIAISSESPALLHWISIGLGPIDSWSLVDKRSAAFTIESEPDIERSAGRASGAHNRVRSLGR